ncbi:SDR family oxidoreductase [Lutimaribacter sp. EGI FJ00015]|uniref:SDR family oxidoreductase n=1 Tax=Lutimaribacter degradans TaxID=2945989 RepID=A0ACC6A1L2_9RHOB|nr:SDR family oxidoreductase [Lutimaribacter sp. EGI FJ00013]MCM2563489.1 SDR family oxidoreductase [Lutimaribacter sp. EGI FJ00013]MCO0614669.1 SDR family oxidoreductase [Lutimaribacter sp. EGI FJ00015]MCO0637339.1 SDR family oxidoreductase [Lutimaribacter sp. EGI FJ00014]
MKTIVITGASAGIGADCAREFLEAGWHVGLIARREDKLARVTQGFENAVVLPCDVTEPQAVSAAFDSFVARAGRLDVLFNNAGMFGRAATIDDLSFDEWRQVVDVNLHGMFLCAQAAFRIMRAQRPQGGRIINNGSISAHTPRELSVCYTTTKHAITGLTKTLSLDGRAFDIACGQIDIGNALTDLLQGIIDQNPDNPPPHMDVSDVSRAVRQMAELGPEANVQFMTIMATKMPYIGRG